MITRRDLLLGTGAFALGSLFAPAFSFAEEKKNIADLMDLICEHDYCEEHRQ